MKNLVAGLLLLVSIQFTSHPFSQDTAIFSGRPSGNVFIITLDGFRWQELFLGADSSLLADEQVTPDGATIRSLYWSPEIEGRRKKLMPFFWNIIEQQGTLYGNRLLGNKVNTANPYAISYPGYNEIFTGNPDPGISTNDKVFNSNPNILEYLYKQTAFKGRVAAVTSWDVFPYILDSVRNRFLINSGYMDLSYGTNSEKNELFNRLQKQHSETKSATRDDLLTFVAAREYIQSNKPRVFFLGLGETDEAAHDRRYDLYLEKAAAADRMIGELWHWVQTTPGYKDNTTFIITTDHGRGNRNANWNRHGLFVSGSSQTWIALIGPGLTSAGECKISQQLYQKQLAKTIALSVGEEFSLADKKTPPIGTW